MFTFVQAKPRDSLAPADGVKVSLGTLAAGNKRDAQNILAHGC